MIAAAVAGRANAAQIDAELAGESAHGRAGCGGGVAVAGTFVVSHFRSIGGAAAGWDAKARFARSLSWAQGG